MSGVRTRRWVLKTLGGGLAAASAVGRSHAAAPTAPVAVAKCKTYEASELLPALERMFDQIGGLGRVVNGKTVAIKINLTGNATARLGHAPVGETTWTHPAVIAATLHLMDKAGARRIRLLESPWSTAEPLEEFMIQAGWDPGEFTSAARRVEFENTNYLGMGKEYHRFPVPRGGHLFPAYDLNHSYKDCDVFASIAKLKEHGTAGITLAMKNCFGITPCTIYGEGAGKDEPTPVPRGGRSGVIHFGRRPPSLSAPQEKDPNSPREGGYRVPRVVADLAAARPIDLSIVEGVESQAVGETAGSRNSFAVSPGVLLAGLNAVTTDAVGAALMGFDPMADRGKTPFEYCDSTLRLAEELGVGTRDLSRIEVIGTPIRDAVFDFREARRKRGIPDPQPPRAWRG
ncbi:MAG: DUF362 domain-containing protein [Bryobacteraceae bacterium]|nr:DUF362 domain-containing protein [Bryobacteraceae bacterium]